MISPVQPLLHDALSDIAEELKLSADAKARLREAIFAMQTDLRRYREIRDRYAAYGGRAGVIKYCKGLAATFRELDRHLSTDNRLSIQLLGILYPRVLAKVLDHRVFPEYIRADLTMDLGPFDDSRRSRIERGEGFDAAIDELTERKGRAAESESRRLLLGLVRDLAEPLRSYLEIERQRRGGRPPMKERDFVLNRIVEIFPLITGQEPTGSPSGAFITLCERVLEALGISTDGVDTAAQRCLRRSVRSRRRASS